MRTLKDGTIILNKQEEKLFSKVYYQRYLKKGNTARVRKYRAKKRALQNKGKKISTVQLDKKN